MKERIKSNLISWIVAVVLIVTSVLYVAINSGDHTFAWLNFIMLLVGAAVLIGGTFLPAVIKPYVPLVSAIAVAVAFGHQFQLTLETLSDVWNGVSFIGGSPAMGVTFSVLFFLAAAALIVRCFLKEKAE
ncbi:MAG: hypothetical protein IJS52_00685 [Bacilli bacterium]|nr:hypothetical protein [Bacilli bacterium]